MAGSFVAPQPDPPSLTNEGKKVAEGFARMGAVQAQALLVHCSQEKSHLAQFLPDTYREYQCRGGDS
jgi:hypothetical protein